MEGAQDLFKSFCHSVERMAKRDARLRNPHHDWNTTIDAWLERMIESGVVSSDPEVRYSARNLQQHLVGTFFESPPAGRTLEEIRTVFERMEILHERASTEVPFETAPDLFLNLLQNTISGFQGAGFLYGQAEAWIDAAKALDLALEASELWMKLAATRRDLDEIKTTDNAMISLRDLRVSALKRGGEYREALPLLLQTILHCSVIAMIKQAPIVLQKREKLLDDFHKLMISLELAAEVDNAIRKTESIRPFLHADGKPLHWSEIFLRHHEILLETLRSQRDVAGVEALEQVVRVVREHIPPDLVAGVANMNPVWEAPFLVFRGASSEVQIPMNEGPATRGIKTIPQRTEGA